MVATGGGPGSPVGSFFWLVMLAWCGREARVGGWGLRLRGGTGWMVGWMDGQGRGGEALVGTLLGTLVHLISQSESTYDDNYIFLPSSSGNNGIAVVWCSGHYSSFPATCG